MRRPFILNSAAYIFFFVAGTLLFFYLSWNVRVPVYETVNGTVQIEGTDVQIAFDGVENPSVNRIYYYIQRDEWIEAVERGKGESSFTVENYHGLENGQNVTVDIEVGDISLLRAVFVIQK